MCKRLQNWIVTPYMHKAIEENLIQTIPYVPFATEN